METLKCRLKKQGLPPGSCLVKVDGKHQPACQATLKYEKGDIYRLITSVHQFFVFHAFFQDVLSCVPGPILYLAEIPGVTFPAGEIASGLIYGEIIFRP